MSTIETRHALMLENQRMQGRLEELEETLRAIREGEIDALVMSKPEGDQVYTLKGALEPYRVMVEVMSEGAVSLTRDGTILYCNRRFAQISGMPQERIVGMDLRDWIAADDADTYVRLLAEGWIRPTHQNLRIRACAGEFLPARLSVSPLPEGEDKAIAAVITDLSDVVAAERARAMQQESESRFRYFFDHSPVGKVMSTADGRMEANRAFCQMLGYSKDELAVLRWQDVTHPDDMARSEEASAALFSGAKASVHFVKRYLHRNGNVVWTELTASRGEVKAGQPTYLMTNVVDITERRQAEQAAHLLQARFETIFSQAPLGIAVIDSHTGAIQELNPRFAEIAGRSMHEMQALEWMSITHPDDVQPDLDNMALLNAGKIPGFSMDKRYMRPDGSAVWIRMTVAPLRAESPCHRHLCMIDDITERKSAEESIRKLNADLELRVAERTADLEGFAYSVSHDLRVPLRAIDGFSNLVVTGYREVLDDEGKRMLGLVRDSAAKMARLIDDILAFSRTGRLALNAAAVDMDALLRSAWEELMDATPDHTVRLDVQPLPHVHGDAAMLRQVWVNLLGNAIKFSSSRPDAHIEVDAHSEGGQCVFRVKDNGVGFDMRYVNKLFGVFQRLHGVDEFDGTGIGLAIVKRIVTRHGGRAWAEGEVGAGATFYFSIPESNEASP